MNTPSNASPPPLPPLLAVRYCLTKGDLFRWQVYQSLRNRVLVGFFILCTAFLVYSNREQPALADRSILFKCFFVLFCAGVFGGILFLLNLVMLWLLVALRPHKGLVGEHVLEITEAGLVERTELNESLHRWQGFYKVISTKSFLYIYVTDALVHVVPKRAFPGDSEAQEFQSAIERHGAKTVT